MYLCQRASSFFLSTADLLGSLLYLSGAWKKLSTARSSFQSWALRQAIAAFSLVCVKAMNCRTFSFCELFNLCYKNQTTVGLNKVLLWVFCWNILLHCNSYHFDRLPWNRSRGQICAFGKCWFHNRPKIWCLKPTESFKPNGWSSCILSTWQLLKSRFLYSSIPYYKVYLLHDYSYTCFFYKLCLSTYSSNEKKYICVINTDHDSTPL